MSESKIKKKVLGYEARGNKFLRDHIEDAPLTRNAMRRLPKNLRVDHNKFTIRSLKICWLIRSLAYNFK